MCGTLTHVTTDHIVICRVCLQCIKCENAIGHMFGISDLLPCSSMEKSQGCYSSGKGLVYTIPSQQSPAKGITYKGVSEVYPMALSVGEEGLLEPMQGRGKHRLHS